MSKFKQLRLAAGLTQRELAKYARVKQGVIAEYESGVRDIEDETFSVAQRIASAMGVTIEELLEEKR